MAVTVLVQAVLTLALTGLIWFVQVVHYPLYAWVGDGSFVDYELEHERRVSWVVVPLMLGELAATVLLVVSTPHAVPAWLAWLGAALLAVVWLSTALVQVAAHDELEEGYDAQRIAWLVRSNWVRTLAWSGRAVVAVAMLQLVSR